MTKKQFVHAREFAYGWDYTEFDQNNEIVLYDTKEEAEAALLEYINDTNEAFIQGDLNRPYEGDCAVFEYPLKN